MTLSEAVAETKRLSERLADFCQEIGRDPSSVRRSVQALNPVPDPFTSLDAFDEYVGAYQEIGSTSRSSTAADRILRGAWVDPGR